MKYLTVPRLQKLSAMMQAVDVGDRIVHARIEAYSCKIAGADKRTAKDIIQSVTSELSHPGGVYQLSHSLSPLGDLHEPATKQLLVSLITTLNASYPDYDFSGLRAEDFEREDSPQAAINSINNLFVIALESAIGVTGFRSELWSALEETIFLNECEVYKYDPGCSGNDESVGKLWSINYFFYHRKLKKMVLLASEAISKLHMQTTHSAAYQQYAQRHAHHHHSADADMHADEWASDDDDDDFDSDGGDSDCPQQAAQDAEDDAMEAAEDEILQELAAENGDAGGEQQSGLVAGSYVDASLLEWEVPLDQQTLQAPHTPATSGFDSSSNLAPYESSPSASSTSSVATLRLRPLPDVSTPTLTPQSASANHSPHASLILSPQVRLASTKSPVMRAAVGKSFANPIVIGGPATTATAMTPTGSIGVGGHASLPPRPQGTSLFGGSRSSFSPRHSPSHATQLPTPSGSMLPAVPTFTQ